MYPKSCPFFAGDTIQGCRVGRSRSQAHLSLNHFNDIGLRDGRKVRYSFTFKRFYDSRK